MKKKLLFFACLLLLGGVSSAWATVTATLSGMNKVGDYYYPIYTLSESVSISSFTSSNGEAPATITDGTTLTFSHRGTVTLSDNTVVEGKKYSATVYDFTSISQPGATLLGTDKKDGIWGFTKTIYSRAQIGGIAKGSPNTTAYTGLSISNTGSKALYLNFYYASSAVRYGMQLNSSSGKVTVTDGAKIAKLDYYDNHSAVNTDWTGDNKQYPTEDLTLSEYKQVDWATGENPEFILHERTEFYLYETLTTYTEVAESLTEATATLTGFAETSGYYYPVYTITATHDEDGTVNPTLTDGEGFDVATNVLTYTERTASETNVTITYGGVNTTVEVPASVKYKKTNYNFAEASTFTYQGSGAKDGAPSGFSGTSSVARFYVVEDAGSAYTNNGITFGPSGYKWTFFTGYGIGFSKNKSLPTSYISKSDLTDGSYAILTWQKGASDDTPAWGSATNTRMVAETDGTVSFTELLDKDTPNFCYYTSLDIYEPVSETIVGTYSLNESSFTANDGKYYRQYTINATKDDTAYDNFTVALKSGTATVEGKTVTYTGTEIATVTLTDNDGSDTTYDLELPTSVAYLLTNNYNFGLKSTYPSSIIDTNSKGAINGFNTGDKTRYKIGASSTTPAAMFDNITLGFARWGWIGYEDNSNTFGIQFVAENVGSTTSTIKFSNAIAGQVAVLNYTVGNNSDNDGKGTNWSARVMQADVLTASSSDITFTVHDRGVLETTGKGYVYTSLQVYTPVSIATQSVTVSSGINMGTLVAPYPLDFSDNEGIKAYTATSTGEDGSAVRFTRINKVPAYTPVLIYKDGGATSDISFVNAEEADTPDASNMLKAGTGAAVPTNPTVGTTNYILSKSSTEEVYGFFYANDAVVPATKAYLQVTGTASSRLSVIFDDQETTGIGRVEGTTTKDATIYNLNGQRVNAPAKGLYIVNGKKIIIK